jgi:hypothetical protein
MVRLALISIAASTFALSFALPQSWDRAALQENAFEVIGSQYPSRAFDLINRMDTPVSMSGQLNEDLRAFVAASLYPALWQNAPKAQEGRDDLLDRIRMQARSIAVTGEYPFIGMLPILKDLMGRDRLKGQAV